MKIETPLGIGEIIDDLTNGYIQVRFGKRNEEWFHKSECKELQQEEQINANPYNRTT